MAPIHADESPGKICAICVICGFIFQAVDGDVH
jgi:hypothetical protein